MSIVQIQALALVVILITRCLLNARSVKNKTALLLDYIRDCSADLYQKKSLVEVVMYNSTRGLQLRFFYEGRL